MATKLIYVDANGIQHELEGISVSTGAPDAGKFFVPGSDGKWDISLMPTGIGPATKTIVASEAMTAPCLVNVWNDTGTPKVRYADASAANASKVANGFLLASVASGANATVYFEGEITGLSGLTAGTMFLSATPGLASAAVVTTAGHTLQKVGTATSATTIDFEAQSPIIRA